MNRKSNPWVALVALILAAVLLVLTCTGCDAEATEEAPRFVVEEASAKKLGAHQHVEIITDTETGVQYIYFKSSNAGGLTVLQPAPDTEEVRP